MQLSPTSHNILRDIADKLTARGETLAVAESCTGGLVGAYCTSLSGSSQWFSGGAIVYQNYLKEELLGVQSQTLTRDGAVSSSCVSEMLVGCKRLFKSDWTLAISGIAGPEGGTDDKLVGLVFIGVGGPMRSSITETVFLGNRDSIREQATLQALLLLLKQF